MIREALNAGRPVFYSCSGSSMWPPAKKKAAGLCESDVCSFCPSGAVGTMGHQLYDCEGVLDCPRNRGQAYPEDVVEWRAQLRERGESAMGVSD